MSQEFIDLSAEELDGLIERVKNAAEHGLALSADDLGLLLKGLLMLTALQERMTDHDITLHKLRKLAGIVQSSEKLSAILPQAGKESGAKKPRKKPKPPTERAIHQRCTHSLDGLAKGQRCPECQRGTLYPYDPALVLRISGQTPLISTQHILQRVRCNTCGAYFTAAAPAAVTDDGPVDQKYGYSARALMAIQRYFGGAPFNRQQSLQQLFGFPVAASSVFDSTGEKAMAVCRRNDAKKPLPEAVVRASSWPIRSSRCSPTCWCWPRGPICSWSTIPPTGS
jgi:transposase